MLRGRHPKPAQGHGRCRDRIESWVPSIPVWSSYRAELWLKGPDHEPIYHIALHIFQCIAMQLAGMNLLYVTDPPAVETRLGQLWDKPVAMVLYIYIYCRVQVRGREKRDEKESRGVPGPSRTTKKACQRPGRYMTVTTWLVHFMLLF